MWISKPDELSRWALNEFLEERGEDWQKQLIVNEKDALTYCTHVEDDPKMRKLIKSPNLALEYCINVKDRFWVVSKIWGEPKYLEKYLLQVRGWREFWAEFFLFFYCVVVLSFIMPACLIGLFFIWVGEKCG